MRRSCLAFLLALAIFAALPALAYDGLVEKKVFAMPSFTTVGGEVIKNVQFGYETYGHLKFSGKRKPNMRPRPIAMSE